MYYCTPIDDSGPFARCCKSSATWQRCRVYFMRNALAHAGRRDRNVMPAFIATEFAQDNAEAARGPMAKSRRPAMSQAS